ncbi:TPA: hypothetical protein ACTYW0_004558 [Enterobacter asburiae]
MMSKFQSDTLERYVSEHPGAKSPEIIKNTGIHPSSVASVLRHMVGEKILRREGQRGSYRYYKYDRNQKFNSHGEPIVDHDLPNPLTAFINQRLREVRA